MSGSSLLGRPGTRAAALTGVVVAALVAVAVLLWSKRFPCTGKTLDAPASSTWDGSDVLAVGGVRMVGRALGWRATAATGAPAGAALLAVL